MAPNLACLIKSASIRIAKNLVLLVLYYYHQEHVEGPDGSNHTVKDKTFYRCACKVDTIENWLKLAESVSSSDPAERFTLDQFGLPDILQLKSDYIWSRMNASRWLKLKMSARKILSIDEFINGRKTSKRPRKKLPGAFETDLPYLKDYQFEGNIISLEYPEDFPEGVWLISTKPHLPRRKPKVITD